MSFVKKVRKLSSKNLIKMQLLTSVQRVKTSVNLAGRDKRNKAETETE